jgi:hypothetical protein
VRFLTPDETAAWATRAGFAVREGFGTPEQRPAHLSYVRLLLPQTPGQVTWLCRFISECLAPRDTCLLWVSQWGVWPSSENWHLYYRLRQSYLEQRLLHEAPGHLFLDYEQADMVSFLQLGIMSGWDMHVLPSLTYGGADTARAFVSHDEWVVLAHRESDYIKQWTEALQRAEMRLLAAGTA